MAKQYTTKRPPRSGAADSFHLDGIWTGYNAIVETCEPYQQETGLLDEYGRPIYVIVGPDPLGFLWEDEYGDLRPRHTVLGE